MKTIHRQTLALPALLLAAALLGLGGCALDAPDDASGPLNPINPPGLEDAGARYVAVGNSLTAGFLDGGLIRSGQVYSYPNLIAGQLGLTSAQFTQPWIASPGIGSSTPSSASNVAGVLYFNGSSIAVLDETPLADVQSTLLLAVRQPTQYHNLGVPGATLYDGLNAYSAATSAAALAGQTPNSFFDFINRSALFGNRQLSATVGASTVTYQSASQVYQAIAKGGALATFWLGNNDVLGPATSGEPPAGFGNPGSAGALTFQARYTATLSVLAGGLRQRNYGLKPTIVVANIPSVASTPYFVPKATFDAFCVSQIGVVWPGGFAESNVVYVRFPALSWISSHAPSTPIPADYTLDQGEATDVATATTVFNTIIGQVAAAVNGAGVANVGVMDANDLLAHGVSDAQRTHFLFLLGAPMTVAQAAATTVFSLDGIHPNPHGYGIVANRFIDKINEIDGTSLAHVDPAALAWDPTYGQATAKAGGPLGLEAGAAEAMDAIFR